MLGPRGHNGRGAWKTGAAATAVASQPYRSTVYRSPNAAITRPSSPEGTDVIVGTAFREIYEGARSIAFMSFFPPTNAPTRTLVMFALTVSIVTFAGMKFREMIKLLKADGWYLARARGSHQQYRHAEKPGLVTLAGHGNDDVGPRTLKSILKQAGLEKPRLREK